MKTIRDYYTVTVPGDAMNSIEDLADLAITEARERTRLYVMPAEWTATHVGGALGDFSVTFRVRRRRIDNQ